jgi:hypothetical protein
VGSPEGVFGFFTALLVFPALGIVKSGPLGIIPGAFPVTPVFVSVTIRAKPTTVVEAPALLPKAETSKRGKRAADGCAGHGGLHLCKL